MSCGSLMCKALSTYLESEPNDNINGSARTDVKDIVIVCYCLKNLILLWSSKQYDQELGRALPRPAIETNLIGVC